MIWQCLWWLFTSVRVTDLTYAKSAPGLLSSIWVLVAQWLEHLTGDQKVADSIHVWGSETFFWVCDKAWVAKSVPLKTLMMMKSLPKFQQSWTSSAPRSKTFWQQWISRWVKKFKISRKGTKGDGKGKVYCFWIARVFSGCLATLFLKYI